MTQESKDAAGCVVVMVLLGTIIVAPFVVAQHHKVAAEHRRVDEIVGVWEVRDTFGIPHSLGVRRAILERDNGDRVEYDPAGELVAGDVVVLSPAHKGESNMALVRARWVRIHLERVRK